ncbi:MAG: hypothetical protein A2Z91_08620 [Deltaproteobacteria bacterium GWA2_38_16]|nr:MAG: hypothetical protein A2Z91_08620 [Deltaproteobacteria bacterium GWA2_38_16]OGQ03857.1 MAG: hypothetical protein A3D19_07185 [Deltaproteobacteria bacterium RIFCSPHIGHO2_02_FULL_38_15]OGQ33323.1 MAG: hypothetical protein A3A72_08465 [Deltaproteobacteria bacterium RIFCSPLOWO2_01_FULL_38_9]HBQ20903.1 hypothetical protein [Deltaproteobacteria bacterium]
MKSTFLQKITSLWVCVCFVGTLATPYTVYAQVPLAIVAPNTQFGRLLEAHKLLEMVPSQNMAQKILEESQTLLASSQLPEDQYQALYGKTKRLARALDLSTQFGECSGQQGAESQAFRVFLQSDRPLACSKISGPVSQSTSTIEDLAKDTSHITEQITLDTFVDDLSDQTMEAMFTNYWMYKSTFSTPVPEDMDLAIKEVFGTLPVDKGKYLPLLGHVMNQTTHTNIAQKQQDMMAQLQTSVNRIKAIRVLPRYYETVARYADRPTMGFQGGFQEYGQEFTPVFSRGAFEEYAPERIAPTIEEGVGALWRMKETRNPDLQAFEWPIQNMFESLMGGTRPKGSTYIPSYFEEYSQWLKHAPQWQIEGESNPQFSFLNVTPMYPLVREPRLPELFLARQKDAFKERLPVDIHLAEMAKSPLLFTKPFRDFVDSIDDDPSHLPTITQDHLNSALKDQQDTIRTQVQELNDLKSKNPKEALKEFLKRDPLRVWKLAFEHPEMMDAICTATQGIKIDKESKEWWDKVYFWGGLGIGALALLTGVGALGLAAYGAGAGVMTAAGYAVVGTTALSFGTGIAFTGREVLNAGEASQNYQTLYASIVSDMGGDPNAALHELDDFNSHVFSAVLAGSFSALDIAGIYAGVRSLAQLRQAKSLVISKTVPLTETASDLPTASTYVPGSASAWHRLGDTAGDMPLGPTSGPVMTERGYYRIDANPHPTKPGQVDVFSVHYRPTGSEHSQLVFPKASTAGGIPKIVSRASHVVISGRLLESQEYMMAATRLERAIERYRTEFFKTMQSLGGPSGEELGPTIKYLLDQFAGKGKTTAHTAYRIFEDLNASYVPDHFLETIPNVERGAQRFEGGLQQLEEFKALATQSH